MSPELSIAFRSEGNEQVLQVTAEEVARYGFDVVSVYEDLGDPSPMYPLMSFAKAQKAHDTNTNTSAPTRFGPACIVVPKHPSLDSVVGEISRLDQIYPGRAYLGLAAGAWMDKVGLKDATVNQVREAAEVAKYLFSKQDDGFEGTYFTVSPGFTINSKTPEGKVPLLIGAWSPKMAAMAGEIADEIKVGGSVNPVMIPLMRDRVRVGSERAGRDSDAVGIVMGAVTVVSENREEAKSYARGKAAIYIEAIGHKDPTAMMDFPDEVTKIQELVRAGDIKSATEFMPDALMSRFVMAGTPEDVILQTEALFEAGASRVEYGTPHGLEEIEGIRLLGEKVLPYFK